MKSYEHWLSSSWASRCGGRNGILKTASWIDVIHVFYMRKLRMRELHNLPKISITTWWGFPLSLSTAKSASAWPTSPWHRGLKQRNCKGARLTVSVPSFHVKDAVVAHWCGIWWTFAFTFGRNNLPLTGHNRTHLIGLFRSLNSVNRS